MTIAVSLDWQPIEVQGNIALTTVWVPPVPWELDTSFVQWTWFNAQVHGVTEYWDEYVFWGDNGSNYYNSYNGVASLNANKIVPFFRIKKDNRLPDSNSILGANFNFWNLVVSNQFVIAGGFIYFVWGFSTFNNVASKHILKIKESDLSIDTVNTWVWFSSTNFIQIRYANSKIFVWWSSASTYNWWTSTRLQVFNTDLTVDTVLTSFFLPNNTVTCIYEQTDGKVIIAWTFTNIWWTTQNRIVRYNTDWTVDTTFTTNVWTWPSAEIRTIKQLSNGKLVLWWTFTTFNGTTSQRIIILNTDGTISNSVASWFNGEINIVAIDWSDNIFCWGFFQTYWGVSRLWLCKLWSTLTLDTTYTPVFDTNARIYTINIDWSELIVWTSNFEVTLNWSAIWWIFSTDLTNWTLSNTFYGGVWSVWEIRKVIIFWSYIYIYWWLNFTQYANNRAYDWELTTFVSFVKKTGVLTQNLDKFYDTTWNSYNIVKCIKNWNILGVLASRSQWYWDHVTSWITQFISKKIDKTFSVSTLSNTIVTGLYDNNWYIAIGNFTNGIVKVWNNWLVDATFNVWSWFNSFMQSISKTNAEKYLIVGGFSTYKWFACTRICVLDNLWNRDTWFIEWSSINSSSSKWLALSNWNYLIYWNFSTYKWVACNRAIILDINGNQIPWLWSNFNFRPLNAVEHNWKIYFTWWFVTFWATTVNRIACIDLATGQLDNIFGTGLNGTWNDIYVDSEWKLVVVWNFTTYNWNTVGNVARIFI